MELRAGSNSMTPEQQLAAVVECLNGAFAEDPAAVRAMLINCVPCNMAMADGPNVIVDVVSGVATPFVRMLGVLNGALSAAGIGIVGSKWSYERDDEGCATLLGFCGNPLKDRGHADQT